MPIAIPSPMNIYYLLLMHVFFSFLQILNIHIIWIIFSVSLHFEWWVLIPRFKLTAIDILFVKWFSHSSTPLCANCETNNISNDMIGILFNSIMNLKIQNSIIECPGRSLTIIQTRRMERQWLNGHSFEIN